MLKEAIAKAGYTNEVVIGMDVAASEFYREGKYDLDFKSPDDRSHTHIEQITLESRLLLLETTPQELAH